MFQTDSVMADLMVDQVLEDILVNLMTCELTAVQDDQNSLSKKNDCLEAISFYWILYL